MASLSVASALNDENAVAGGGGAGAGLGAAKNSSLGAAPLKPGAGVPAPASARKAFGNLTNAPAPGTAAKRRFGADLTNSALKPSAAKASVQKAAPAAEKPAPVPAAAATAAAPVAAAAAAGPSSSADAAAEAALQQAAQRLLDEHPQLERPAGRTLAQQLELEEALETAEIEARVTTILTNVCQAIAVPSFDIHYSDDEANDGRPRQRPMPAWLAGYGQGASDDDEASAQPLARLSSAELAQLLPPLPDDTDALLALLPDVPLPELGEVGAVAAAAGAAGAAGEQPQAAAPASPGDTPW